MTTMHSPSMPSRTEHRDHPIALAEPLHWLAMGVADYRRAPAVGTAYGLMVTLLGWLVLALGDHPYFIATAVSGFLLVGPILGAGLIESSRMLEAGQSPTFDSSLRAFDRNAAALGRFSLVLLAVAVAWLALSTSLLVATLGPIAPRVDQALWDSARQFMTSGQLLAWLAIGGVLAVLCFCISVIGVPMILDQQASAGEAIRGSLRAVSRHALASAVWAAVIAVLAAIGLATALLGLVVIYPVLGHASWHAYRALQR